MDAVDQLVGHADADRGCNSGHPNVEMTKPGCTWAVPDAVGRIVLVGDSNAGHYTEGLQEAANSRQYDLTVATFEACPLADLILHHLPSNPVFTDACRRYVTRMVDELTTREVGLVVIGSVSDLYLQDPSIEFVSEVDGRVASTLEDKASVWQEALTSTLRTLTAAGVPVVVVQPVPHFINWDPRTCSPVRLNRGGCGRTLQRDEMETMRGPAVTADEAAADASGAHTIDLADDLCAPEVCVTNEDGFWRYRDGLHITVGESLRLSDRFATLVDQYALRAGS